MPTYFVIAPAGALSDAQKQSIASDITRIHSDVTGAQGFFAQVFFNETAAGNHFMGGVVVTRPGVFVYGHVRAGRTAAQKRRLLENIVDALQLQTGLARKFLWAYLHELAPGQMIEYGHLLPQPGMERHWLETLPAEDREYMQNLGAASTGSS